MHIHSHKACKQHKLHIPALNTKHGTLNTDHSQCNVQFTVRYNNNGKSTLQKEEELADDKRRDQYGKGVTEIKVQNLFSLYIDTFKTTYFD